MTELFCHISSLCLRPAGFRIDKMNEFKLDKVIKDAGIGSQWKMNRWTQLSRCGVIRELQKLRLIHGWGCWMETGSISHAGTNYFLQFLLFPCVFMCLPRGLLVASSIPAYVVFKCGRQRSFVTLATAPPPPPLPLYCDSVNQADSGIF